VIPKKCGCRQDRRDYRRGLKLRLGHGQRGPTRGHRNGVSPVAVCSQSTSLTVRMRREIRARFLLRRLLLDGFSPFVHATPALWAGPSAPEKLVNAFWNPEGRQAFAALRAVHSLQIDANFAQIICWFVAHGLDLVGEVLAGPAPRRSAGGRIADPAREVCKIPTIETAFRPRPFIPKARRELWEREEISTAPVREMERARGPARRRPRWRGSDVPFPPEVAACELRHS